MNPFQDLLSGFQSSRVLLTGIELDVFTLLGEGATAAEMAARMKTDARATEMLLNALVSLEALRKEGGRFFNTLESQQFLAGPQRNGLMHTVHLWDSWSRLTECVRRGSPPDYKDIPERDEQWTEAFIAAMERGGAERAPLVVQAVGAEGVRRMLDVGGGSGRYTLEFARANPELRAVIFDLADVLPITQRYIDASGLQDRVTARAGDLRTDSFGSGFDLVLVSSICHMLDEQGNLDLLRRCREAISPGGRLVIQEFVLADDKTQPRAAVLFSLNMLTGTRRGASYSAGEYAAWLREAGFRESRLVQLSGPTALVIAYA
jgi:SAM-dependent methyltransferase